MTAPSDAPGHAGPSGRPQDAADVDHFRAALDGIDAAIFTFDDAQSLLFVGRQVAPMLEADAARLKDCGTVHELLETCTAFDPDSVSEIRATIERVHVTEETHSIVLMAESSKRVFSLQVSSIGRNAWMALCEDITERRAAEHEAINRASHDPLTGLANRKLFTDEVAAELQPSDTDAFTFMMLVDLDRFKAVNDTLGHPIGDALLSLVGKRLVSTLREGDVVARLGGDEFALLIRRQTNRDIIAKLAKRLIDLLGRPYLIDGHLVHVGASIGIADTQDVPDHNHLFRKADLALYAAKKAGRNTFCFFEPVMDLRAHMRRSMEIDLRKAIALRELELHYQPQIDLEQHAIVGFEALARWRHPIRGLVPPSEFIALAEEIGLIVSIGEWVLREACREAARWPETISIAVNVSPYQFENPAALVIAVEKALASSGLPARRLEIEITEGVLLRNEQSVMQALHALRATGVRVAMDDFGTGYSSLSQLSSFPFDKIKIDRSFVSGTGNARDRSAIIRAITSLGESLGMATIAEGVETVEELGRIRAHGCHSVQGYLFSRPLKVTDVEDFIATFSGEPKSQLKRA